MVSQKKKEKKLSEKLMISLRMKVDFLELQQENILKEMKRMWRKLKRK